MRIIKPGGALAKIRDHRILRTAIRTAVILAAAALLQGGSRLLHLPGLPYLLMTIAVLGYHKLRNAWEALRFRRSGGKRASRHRSRFQGPASRREIRRYLSPQAVLKKAHILRPSLADTPRGKIPVTEVGIPVGRTITPALVPSQQVVLSGEKVLGVLGIPRTGKTGFLAGVTLDAPGCAVVTGVRPDIISNTAMARVGGGPVWILNRAGGIFPTTLKWSPTDGCHRAAGAIENAGYLMAAAPKMQDSGFWDAQGGQLLQLALHAAALGGYTMQDVRIWVADPAHPDFMEMLGKPGAADGWAADLEGICALPGETLAGVILAARNALSWLSDPEMAAVACPAEGDDVFSAEEFITLGGTLYLIGDETPGSALAPYFSLLTGHIFETGRRMAHGSPGGRLDPPGTIVADEAPNICRVPLKKWTSIAGGSGWRLVWGSQSISGLEAAWGEKDARAILTNSAKLVLGGHSDPAELTALSLICGRRDTWRAVKNPDGSASRQPDTELLWPEERIKAIGERRGLYLDASVRSVLLGLTPAWKRPDYDPVPHDLFDDVPEDEDVREPARLALPAGSSPDSSGPGEFDPGEVVEGIVVAASALAGSREEGN